MKAVIKITKPILIVFLGNIAAGVFNYLYHFLCGRLLLPEQYGLLQSFIALSYFLAILTTAFSLSTINLISKAKKAFLSLLITNLEKLALKLSFGFWLVSLAGFFLLRELLHLKSFLIYLIFSLQIWFSFLPTVYFSFLRTKLRFSEFSSFAVLRILGKNIFALFFILAGWQIAGALGAISVSGALITLLTRRWILRPLPKAVRKLPPSLSLDCHFWHYSFLALFTNLALTSLYSTDILLVRHYFSSFESGLYAAVSVLGKIIFFVSTSVLVVIFPLFVEHKKNLKKIKQLFSFAFCTIGFSGLTGLIFYKLMPQFIIYLLYGKSYLQAYKFLFLFALFIFLLTLFNLVIHFFLALEKRLAGGLATTVAIIQIALIIPRHQSLKMIINNSIISVGFGLLLGMFFAIKKLRR